MGEVESGAEVNEQGSQGQGGPRGPRSGFGFDSGSDCKSLESPEQGSTWPDLDVERSICLCVENRLSAEAGKSSRCPL